MKVVSKENVRKELQSCLNQDRRNGLKGVKYFYHYGTKQFMAVDSKQQYEQCLDTYEKQGIILDRIEPISEEHKKMFGIKEGRMMFFRQKENKNISGNWCPLGFCFDWMVGSSEWFMLDVDELTKTSVKTKNHIIPFTHIERDINPNPHGLKEWIFSGGKVYSINERNAKKKAKKLGILV